MRKGASLLTLFILLSSPAWGDEAEIKSRITSKQKQQNFVEVEIGSGFGAFSNPIIPVATPASERSATNSATVSDHQGFQVSMLAGWRGRYGGNSPHASFEYLKMMDSFRQGTGRQVAAGYSRMEIDLGYDYWIINTFAGGLVVKNRRNMYSTRGESHVLDSVMPGLGIKIRQGRFELGGQGYYGVYSAYGFNNNSSINNESLGATTAEVYGGEVTAAYRMTKSAQLILGAEHEVAQVTVSDITSYDGFGIKVPPTAPRTRSYELTTSLFRIGFMKRM